MARMPSYLEWLTIDGNRQLTPPSLIHVHVTEIEWLNDCMVQHPVEMCATTMIL